MISTASFDGHVTMYSLLGGGTSGHEEPVEQVCVVQCTVVPLNSGCGGTGHFVLYKGVVLSLEVKM